MRGGRFGDALFVVGADEGAAFPTWKEPDEVLRWVRLAVGTRSGYPPPDLERYGDRVVPFELDSPDVSRRPTCASGSRAASRSTTSCRPRSPARFESSASIVARLDSRPREELKRH